MLRQINSLPFLQGGGTLGALTRTFDWSKTPVGLPEQWPQSLRTTVSNLLRSKFPMMLWWGEENIQFYNDAYLPLMGKKHPAALGQKAADCWPELWDKITPLLQQVAATGEGVWMEDRLVRVNRNGQMENGYCTFSYSSVLDDAGNHAGTFVTCTETTDKINAINKLTISEHLFQNVVREAMVGIIVLKGEDMRVEVVNEAYGMLINRKPEELWGKNLFDIIPETENEFRPLLNNVRTTGQPVYQYDHPYTIFTNGTSLTGYLNVVYQPYREFEDTITGVMAICLDVTEQVTARKKVEQGRKDLQNTIINAPIGVCVINAATLVCEIVNGTFVAVAGKPYHDIAGKKYWDVFAEAKPFYEAALDNVIKEGKSYHANEVPLLVQRHGKEENIYVTFVYEPLKSDDGLVEKVVVWVIDNTHQVLIRQKVEESNNKVRSIIENAPFPIGVYTGKEMKIEFVNQSITDVWGKGKDVVGKLYSEVLPELESQQIYPQLDAVYTTGKPFHAINQRVDLVVDGLLQPFYFNYSFTPLFDTAGNVYGVMNTAANVTDLNVAKQKVEQSEENLRNMILHAPVAMCILKGPEQVVEIVNERMLQLWGTTAANVWNKPIFEGLPEVKNQGFETLLNSVFTTGETVKAFSQPVTLPRNGSVATVYVDFVYEAFREGEGTITGVMAIAVEVTEQVLARQRIEEVVKTRTLELAEANEALHHTNETLKRSNANLEEFAHAASHDLKEPVRKIHFFTQQLKDQLLPNLKEMEVRSFNRIENATQRMGNLIDDLLLYSHVSHRPQLMDTVDLTQIMQDVMEDLELDILEKAAVINIVDLPVVQGHRRQLQQLFQNLISNALKYSKATVAPVIDITAHKVQEHDVQYYSIIVQDNGIGFEQQYADKIFQMFSRLHGRAEYSGTGIGLSIVKKVIENHNGFIRVKSTPGEGSVFTVYLPAEANI